MACVERGTDGLDIGLIIDARPVVAIHEVGRLAIDLVECIGDIVVGSVWSIVPGVGKVMVTVRDDLVHAPLYKGSSLDRDGGSDKEEE